MLRQRSQPVIPGNLDHLQAAFLLCIVVFQLFQGSGGQIGALLGNLGNLADR
ncbi:hypothetical protein D3C81_2153950 [compost metagenome]